MSSSNNYIAEILSANTKIIEQNSNIVQSNKKIKEKITQIYDDIKSHQDMRAWLAQIKSASVLNSYVTADK